MTALELVPALPAPAVPVMPVDPESLDATRPVDLDTCPLCMGDGAVQRCACGEWQAEPCWSCHGTGQRGAA